MYQKQTWTSQDGDAAIHGEPNTPGTKRFDVGATSGLGRWQERRTGG